MMQKRDHIKKPDSLCSGIEMTEDIKCIRVPEGQSCKTLPRVLCPEKEAEFCVFNIIQITPVEMDYACPACGKVIKRDVFTTGGWKTLVLDKSHEL
jgi:hypothetical protein